MTDSQGGGGGGTARSVAQGCIRRERASEAAPEAVRQAVGGGCRSGWGRLLSVLSVTNAVEAGTWRHGDRAGQRLGALEGVRGGGGVGTRPWWLALVACGGAYWPLALEPSAMTSRPPYYCGHPRCRGHPPCLGGDSRGGGGVPPLPFQCIPAAPPPPPFSSGVPESWSHQQDRQNKIGEVGRIRPPIWREGGGGWRYVMQSIADHEPRCPKSGPRHSIGSMPRTDCRTSAERRPTSGR